MLLQTNSYIVPKDKRTQHTRLVQRFRQTLTRLGCDHFEAYEQVGANWSPADTTGRFVQLMRFRDRKHQLAVQAAERNDATAQALIKEFCELINFPYQQQQGLFAVGFYHSLLPSFTPRPPTAAPAQEETEASTQAHDQAGQTSEDVTEPQSLHPKAPVRMQSEESEPAPLSLAAEPPDDDLPEIDGLAIEREGELEGEEPDSDAEALLEEIEAENEVTAEPDPFHTSPTDQHET